MERFDLTRPPAIDLTTPVRPRRADTDSASGAIGDLTMAEVMFGTRPKPRPAMPSITARGSRIAATLFEFVGSSHCSRVKPRQSFAERWSAGVVEQDVGLRAGGDCRGLAGIGGDAVLRSAGFSSDQIAALAG